jgi:ABC-type multidrug transport system ATPase subunit
MEFAIATTALTKSFGRETALRDVSLHITSGSVFALVGANGAGKVPTNSFLIKTIHLRPRKTERRHFDWVGPCPPSEPVAA